eukprot:SAG22_NODE_2133_length_2960_cov_2.910870_2_plen_57_part_00
MRTTACCQDFVEPGGFYILGVHVADKTVTAIALLETVRSGVRLCFNTLGPLMVRTD